MCDRSQMVSKSASSRKQTDSTKAYGVVSKGNGECWLMEEKHTAISIGGGQAGQGYPCVLKKKAIGFDAYNHSITGGWRKH